MASNLIPEVDMLTVSNSSKLQRNAILGFAPTGLSVVDYGGLDRADNFYLDCQKHRDFYRDPYDKVQRPMAFRTHKGKCGIKLDQSIPLLRQPVTWVQERKPVVYPIEYGKEMNLDKGFQLVGRTSRTSATTFKR